MDNLTVRTGGNWDSCVYIGFTEVWYLAFPTLTDRNSRLTDHCKDRVRAAVVNAKAISDRFRADGRLNPTSDELQKAFNRNW